MVTPIKHSFAISLAAAVCAVFYTVFLASCGAPSPRKAADKKGLAFGVSVKAGDVLTPDTVKHIKSHYNLIVPEDSMKWVNIHPKKDFWNWSDMDMMVDFAEKNNIKIKGHTFLWQDQNGPYVHSAKTRDEAISFLTEQITGVMTRYKGRVFEYDVANEVFNEDGSMRDTLWYRLIGPDFLDIAFRTAREADPDAKLLLVDFNTEFAGSAKADAMYELVKGMKERGVPIDGVGHQLHCPAEMNFDEEALRENVRRFHALGLYTSFTEVDVRIKMPVDGDDEERQKLIFSSLMDVAITEPGAGSMVLWGITDKTSWIPRAFPGYGSAHLFDKEMKPKPAYHALMEVLLGK